MLIKIRALIAAIAIVSYVAAPSIAQDFSLMTQTGQTITSSSLQGSVVVLLFSGTQDPQCREGLSALDKISSERYRGKDVKIFWVSVNSPSEVTNDQLKTPCGVSTSVQVLRDANQSVFKRFTGKRGQLPTVVVLDRQGNPAGQPRGGFNPNSDFINDLALTIDGLLKR